MVPCTGFILYSVLVCECVLLLMQKDKFACKQNCLQRYILQVFIYKGNFACSCGHVFAHLHVCVTCGRLSMCVCVFICCLRGSNTVWAHSGALCQ